MNKNETTLTNATALEHIFDISRNSGFSEDFILAAEPYVDYLQQHFHLTGTAKEVAIQYAVMALTIEEDAAIAKRDIARHANITNISMLGFSSSKISRANSGRSVGERLHRVRRLYVHGYKRKGIPRSVLGYICEHLLRGQNYVLQTIGTST